MPKFFLAIQLIFLLLVSSCNTTTPNETEVAEFIDLWHKAAANSDLDSYFEMMSEDAIYIGTDPGERWTKKEFYQFCEPYFSKGKAWDFKPYNRQIYFEKTKNTIWFDELLKTWMGVCRGSGVITIKNGTYQISHYHLSVTINNENINDFLEIKQN